MNEIDEYWCSLIPKPNDEWKQPVENRYFIYGSPI